MVNGSCYKFKTKLCHSVFFLVLATTTKLKHTISALGLALLKQQ